MIIFSSHSENKLKTSEAKRLGITKDKIGKVLGKPVFQKQLSNDVSRAIGELDQNHSLCVIYKFERNLIKVITFFPAKKGRYEN